ncbi:MAG: translocation/assembly module TamB domain-containing protein [Bacillota bacterium]
MSPRARKVLRLVVASIVVPIILGATLLFYGFSSESVARSLIARALARTGGSVKIGRVSGRLRGPLTLHDVSVKTQMLSATVDSAVLEWTPTGLIHRQARIDRLFVDGVHIVLPDSTPRDTTTPKKPSLPLDVILGDVRAERITVDAPGNVHLTSGAVRVTGRAKDYRIVAAGTLAAPAFDQPVPLTLAGRGDLEHVALDSSSARLLGGRAGATGAIGWYPKVNWDLVVAALGMHPGRMMADSTLWPGAVSAWASTSGRIDSIGPIGRAKVDSLSGALRGQPLGGTLDLRFAGKRYEIPAADVTWGSVHATGDLTLADSAIDARYHVAVGNLATALPAARGSIVLDGTAAGPVRTPHVRTAVSGRNLVYGTSRISRVTGRADVDLAPGGRTTVDLRGDGGRVGQQRFNRVVLAMRGTQRSHRLTADIAAPAASAQLAATGGLHGKAWGGRVASLAIQSARAGDWRLEKPAAVSASASAATLGELCLGSASFGSTRVCAAGAWRPSGWRASSTVEHFPIALIDSLMPAARLGDGRALTGTIEGKLDADATGRQIAGTLHVSAENAELVYREPVDSVTHRVAFDTAVVDVRAGSDGVHGTLNLHATVPDSGAVGFLHGTVALAGYRRLGQPLAGQPLEARLDGELPSLAFLRPFTTADSLRGRLVLGLSARGTVRAPAVDGSLNVTQFMIWLPRGRAGQGEVAVTLASTVHPDRSVDGKLTVVPRGVIYDYTLDLVPQRVVVDSGGLQLLAGRDGVHGLFALGLSDTTRRRLASFTSRLDLPQYHSLGTKLADQPVTFTFEGDVPDLAFARAMTPGVDSLAGRFQATLGATGTVGAPYVTGTLRVSDLVARLIQGSTLTGGVDGNLTANVAPDRTLTAELTVAPVNFALTHTENGTERRITVDSTALTGRVGPDGLHTTLAAQFNQQGSRLATISGRLDLPRYTRFGDSLAPQPLTGRLDGRVADLSFAKAFSPQVDSLAGRVTLDAGLSGTVRSPSVVGGITASDVAAHLPALGVLLHDLQLSALGNREGTFTLDGKVKSGPGDLTITGASPVFPSAARPGHVKVASRNFEVINTDQAHVLATTDLDATLNGGVTRVNGQVTLPLAHVELAEIPVFAVPPSDDVIFTDTLGGSQAAQQQVAANVRIVLGDSVSFKGFNFTASLGGTLNVVEEPGRPTTGSGLIVIKEGHYKAYGQDLTISQGRVRFAGGPVNDPGLDIRATRTAEDSVTAGLQIAGTLKNPDVTVFSTPPMSQNRALEYIVMGHPLNENRSGPQGSMVSKAVSSLGLRGGNLLAKTLGQGIGLDEARIETKGDLQQASFVAGRYLTPNLYVSYGIGLFDPVSILKLRYVISSHWTLQAERGEALGADVLYKIERGRAESRAALAPTAEAKH